MESTERIERILSTQDYLRAYADNEGAAAWRSAHITEAAVPPVWFKADGRDSDTFVWERTCGAGRTVTDYPKEQPVTRQVTEYVWRCPTLGLEVSVEETAYPDFPVVEYLPRIRNIGNAPSPVLSQIQAIRAPLLHAGNVAVHHNNGGAYKCNEYAAFTDWLGDLSGKFGLTFASRVGFPTAFHLPMFNVARENNQGGVIAVLSWAGNWQASMKMDEDDVLCFSGGQYETEYSLMPGETARTPLCVLLYYRGDWMRGQNLWRFWYYRHNVLREQGHRMTTNLLFCITTGDDGMRNTAEENLASIRLSAEKGFNREIDYINVDAGWYECAPDWFHTGNWYPDPKRFPDGLAPLSELSHQNGMLFSLWMEPDRLMKGTRAWRELGERAIYPIREQDGRWRAAKPEEIPENECLMANYADPTVVDYTIDWADAVIKAAKVDQYRQDGNMGELTPFWKAYDRQMAEKLHLPRTGLAEEKYIEGYHRFWRTLIARNPGLIIDSCAAGGRRNDLETVRMSFIHTRSDNYDGTQDTQEQTYGMCMWYMLMGTAMLQIHSTYDCRARLCSSIGFLPPEDEDLPLFWKRIADWKGWMKCFFSVYYPLTPFDHRKDGKLAMQFEDIDRGEGIVALYIRQFGSLTVHPEGLCPDALYRVWSEDTPYLAENRTGADLQEAGITVTAAEQTAFMYHYQRME